MNLAISNIAWTADEDDAVYKLMHQYGFTGLEIAPTRLFEKPYEVNPECLQKARTVIEEAGLSVVAMQSIFHGHPELALFKESERLSAMKHYTCAALRFACAMGVKAVVFGSPRNRVICNQTSQYDIAVDFFRQVGEYALKNNVFLCIEPNPVQYRTNFINTIVEAVQLVKEVNSEGFRLNVDTGTMILNGSPASVLHEALPYMSHLHVSQPFLKPVAQQSPVLYQNIAEILASSSYDKYVSIEMKSDSNDVLGNIERALYYVNKIFGGN